mmetsp:Transcript_7511/g.18618  ORF Transcript_7511/g.18618 Transcript_7511/m.18618 type:complete len:229 (-) Transcript_7511:101-787(-)
MQPAGRAAASALSRSARSTPLNSVGQVGARAAAAGERAASVSAKWNARRLAPVSRTSSTRLSGSECARRPPATPSASRARHALAHSPIAEPSLLLGAGRSAGMSGVGDPGAGRASSTRTGTPARLRASAVASPAMPAPTTTAGGPSHRACAPATTVGAGAAAAGRIMRVRAVFAGGMRAGAGAAVSALMVVAVWRLLLPLYAPPHLQLALQRRGGTVKPCLLVCLAAC